jgi:hypothetical protein
MSNFMDYVLRGGSTVADTKAGLAGQSVYGDSNFGIPNDLKSKMEMDGINMDQFRYWTPEQQRAALAKYDFVDPDGVLSGATEAKDPTQWVEGLDNVDLIKGGLGAVQTALGAFDTFNNYKTAKKNRQLKNQQLEQNRLVIDTAKQRGEEIARDFGSGGLAASVK